jgi:hypothetical protein
MASSKKSTAKTTTGGKKPAPKATASTAVRHSAIPKVEITAAAPVAAPQSITGDMIARRAYEIWASGSGGSEMENWVRAESELRAA